MNDLVCVTWLDAFESTHQHTAADVPHAPLTVETYGVILRDDDLGISLAGERIPGESPTGYRAVTFIPRALIVRVTPFREIKPRKKKEVSP